MKKDEIGSSPEWVLKKGLGARGTKRAAPGKELLDNVGGGP